MHNISVCFVNGTIAVSPPSSSRMGTPHALLVQGVHNPHRAVAVHRPARPSHGAHPSLILCSKGTLQSRVDLDLGEGMQDGWLGGSSC